MGLEAGPPSRTRQKVFGTGHFANDWTSLILLDDASSPIYTTKMNLLGIRL
jgi:hypothetical protein